MTCSAVRTTPTTGGGVDARLRNTDSAFRVLFACQSVYTGFSQSEKGDECKINKSLEIFYFYNTPAPLVNVVGRTIEFAKVHFFSYHLRRTCVLSK